MTSETKPWFFFSFLICFMCTQTHLSAAVDSISSGQSLTLNQTLISTGGNFELGFFRPGNSPNYYIGIWYKKISIENKTYVWVANRNTPLTDPSSSELKLLEDGNLVLLNQTKATVWSTNTTSNSMNSSQAVLGDDGNFVLRNVVRPSDVFWQSFDHTSNTWLPGGKLRYDNITKKPQLLTSWKNANDPSEGLFSLELDPVGEQYLISWNRTQRYWSSGSWNGQIFSGAPEMRLNYIYNFSYISGANESYFTYSVYDQSVISRIVMDLSGQMKIMTWPDNQWVVFWSQPREQCEVYAFCGAFGVCDQNTRPFCKCTEGFEQQSPQNWYQAEYSYVGCVRKTHLECGDRHGFSQMFKVRLPANPQILPVTDADACRLACLNNCSCSAYTFDTGCSYWTQELLNLQQFSKGGSELHLRLASSDIKKSGVKSKGAIEVTACVVAGVTALLALVLSNLERP